MNFNCIEHLESLLTVLALASGGLFFGWKLIAGWLIANLDVIIEVERQKKDDEQDWLSIKILLKKGNIDAIWLKKILIKVYIPNDKNKIEKYYINEIERLIDIEGIENTNKPKKYFAISPGETFQFGKIITIDKENPVMIEVVVLGKRPFWKGYAQWRSTAASLPLVECKSNLI